MSRYHVPRQLAALQSLDGGDSASGSVDGNNVGHPAQFPEQPRRVIPTVLADICGGLTFGILFLDQVVLVGAASLQTLGAKVGAGTSIHQPVGCRLNGPRSPWPLPCSPWPLPCSPPLSSCYGVYYLFKT